MKIDPLIFAPLLLMLTLACVTDLRERRIPNALTFLLIGSGLLNSFIWALPVGPTDAAFGLLLALGLMFVPFALGAMGGGDVKLMAGVGAWVGPEGALEVFVLAALTAAGIALAQALSSGRLLKLLRNTMVLASSLAVSNHMGRASLEEQGRSLTAIDKPLPYAVPVWVGTVGSILLAMS
jgi:prepilin peptidase CpaA